jgi:outer membrane protein W
MFFRKLIVLVFVLGCGASCALAQDSFLQKFEVTPFGGYKFGGKINISQDTSNPNAENLLIASSYDYGAMVDYSIWQNFQAEFMLVRQPSTLNEQFIPPTPSEPLTNTTLTTYTFGAAYSFRGDSKIRPFIAGGLGWTNFTNIDNPSNVYLGFYNKFAYNIGGGVKYYFSKYAGFRFDFRFMSTRTTPGAAEECDEFGDCFEVSQSNHANQGDLNFGLILKF